MFSLTVWIFIVVAILAYLQLRPKKRGINLPGPFQLPILGSVLDFQPRFWMTLVKWSEKYGPLCKFRLGTQPETVIVADPVMAKEMLAMDAFVDRGSLDIFTLFEGENRGLINSSGHVWEQQRRFAVRQLRDFGFGKSSMEAVTMDEVNDMIERFVEFNGKPIENIKGEFSLATVNALWSIVAGTRYPQTDPKLRQLIKQITGGFDEAAKAGAILPLCPWLKHIIPEKSGYNAIRRAMAGLVEFVGKTVSEHRKTHQEDSPRDLIDLYLTEMKTTDTTSSFYGKDGEKQLINVVTDLFQGGADTISTTLDWATLFLLAHPDVQEKLHEEIERVVGNSRQVSLTDRPKMIYTLAFINEVLRKANAPFGVPHKVAFDVEYRGVFFPKDTGIMINLQYIHNDPKNWDNPEKFSPDRFLTDDGKALKKNDVLNPFLVGRRQCPGETLAKDAIFLFVTNLVQKFQLVNDPNSPKPDLEPGISFVVVTRPYNVVFKERKEE